jgi:hypothetical protein
MERGLPLILANATTTHLTRHITVDRGDRRLDAVDRDVAQQHVETGERANVGYAVTHLPGADYADCSNGVRHAQFLPLASSL